MSRRVLQVLLCALAVIPFTNGLAGVVLGADRFGSPVSAELDHTLRYLSGFYAGVAVLIWYAARRVERHGLLVIALTGCVFLGGVARLVSVLELGAASPLQYALIALELALPLLVPWQRRVARDTALTAAA